MGKTCCETAVEEVIAQATEVVTKAKARIKLMKDEIETLKRGVNEELSKENVHSISIKDKEISRMRVLLAATRKRL
jgi:hypothetical protein